jgi:23S rRNA pseudouridine1911/1915/1917 synthase
LKTITLIIVDKPAGLVVHPAAGHADGTLVNALLHHCKGKAERYWRRRSAPELSIASIKDTSGLLVVAKIRCRA